MSEATAIVENFAPRKGGSSHCGSSVSPTAELGKSSAAPMTPGRSPRVTRFREGERARSKAVEGKESGQMDVSGCEETIPANFLFPATQPQGQADPAIRSAQQVSHHKIVMGYYEQRTR